MATAATATAAPAPAALGYSIDDTRITQRTRRWYRNRRELAGFLIDILCLLIEEGATGRLTLNLTGGTAASAQFEQREPSEPSDGDPS